MPNLGNLVDDGSPVSLRRFRNTARQGWLTASLLSLFTLSLAEYARGQVAPPPPGAPPPQIVAHPALRGAPQYTMNVHKRQGDPVNVAFVGTEEELHRAMAEARWYPADPITLKTSLRLVADVLERKPYPDAPVSHLYLFGRVQDLAFEQPVGNSPKQRHHVRFWRSAEVDASGRPLWIGAATYDVRVEISRTTGGITHRIAPEVDNERDKLIRDTGEAGDLAAWYWVEGYHQVLEGRNGAGDPYRTDGRLAVGVIGQRR
ncbi:MAG: LssY C-terminal domain-containing protein [Singulisphaera sp.]